MGSKERLLVSSTRANTADVQFILMKRKKAACCVWREFLFTSQGIENDSECNKQKNGNIKEILLLIRAERYRETSQKALGISVFPHHPKTTKQ